MYLKWTMFKLEPSQVLFGSGRSEFHNSIPFSYTTLNRGGGENGTSKETSVIKTL